MSRTMLGLMRPIVCVGMMFTLVAGCVTRPPKIVYLRPEAPARLMSCPERPPVPGAAATQRSAALFMLALAEAHAVCHERLRALAGLISPIAEDRAP